MPQIPLIGPPYRVLSPNVACQRLSNFYLEEAQQKSAKSQYAAYAAPGFTVFSTFSQAPSRGIFSQNGRCFGVGGDLLYEIFSDGSNTVISTAMAIDQNPATLSSNGPAGHQLFVTSGNNGYIYDLNTAAFSHVLTGARFGAFLDGFFLALNTDTSTLQWSALEDGTSWDPADVAQRNTAGDKWVSMGVAHRQILLLGTDTCEFWYDSGDALNPFQPVDGAFFEIGIDAPYSLGLLNNELTWLGGNEQGRGVFYRAIGNAAPTQISDYGVEFAVQGYSITNDAVAFGYQDQGHYFYVCNFPTGGDAWCTDTKFWHERNYVLQGVQQAYRVQFHTFIFGKHLVGDRSLGVIYQMSINAATEVDGTGIVREIIAPIWLPTRNYVFHMALQVDVEAGLGLPVASTVQGYDPQVMMSVSNDGGHTFGNERWVSAGKAGQYRTRALFQQLGVARGYERVYKLRFSDPISWRLSQGFVDTQEGTH